VLPRRRPIQLKLQSQEEGGEEREVEEGGKEGGELERLCYDFDVLLLQETKTKTVKCPGYTCYNNPTSKTHHGQAILVRNDLQHQILDMDAWDREDREVQAILMEVRGRKWVIVNVYVGVETATKDDDWNFLSDFESLGDTVLIVGDYNARSRSWGNENENAQGKALDRALLGMNFSLLNSREMTRLAQRDNEEDSNIDLALVSTGDET